MPAICPLNTGNHDSIAKTKSIQTYPGCCSSAFWSDRRGACSSIKQLGRKSPRPPEVFPVFNRGILPLIHEETVVPQSAECSPKTSEVWTDLRAVRPRGAGLVALSTESAVSLSCSPEWRFRRNRPTRTVAPSPCCWV